MNRLFRSAARVLLALAIPALALAPAQSGAQPAQPKTIRVAVAGTSLLWLNYFHALDNGYFKDAGVNIVSTMAKNGPLSAQAVLSGEADIGMGDFARVFNLRSKNNDLIAFCVFNVGVEQTMLVSTEIAAGMPANPSVDDAVKAIRGKKIAVSGPGTTNDVILRYLVKSRQHNPDQYLHIISLASAPALYIESFRNKAIDGLVTTEPIISEIVQSGAGKVVFTTLRDMPPADRLPYIVGFAPRPFAIANPDALQAFNRALARSSTQLRNGGYEGAKPTIRKYFPTLSEEAMKGAFARMHWPVAPALERGIVRTTADWQADVGLLPAKVSPEEQDKAFLSVR